MLQHRTSKNDRLKQKPLRSILSTNTALALKDGDYRHHQAFSPIADSWPKVKRKIKKSFTLLSSPTRLNQLYLAALSIITPAAWRTCFLLRRGHYITKSTYHYGFFTS